MARTHLLENGPICLARHPDGRTCGHRATWFLADLACWVCWEHVPPAPRPSVPAWSAEQSALAIPPAVAFAGRAGTFPI